MSDKELNPDYRDIDDKVNDFLREGEKSIYYGAFLKRLAECDQLLENNFLITKASILRNPNTYYGISFLQNENESLVYDIVKDMILEGCIVV